MKDVLKVFIITILIYLLTSCIANCDNQSSLVNSFKLELEKSDYKKLVNILKTAYCKESDSISFSILPLRNARSYGVRNESCNILFDEGESKSLGVLLSSLGIAYVDYNLDYIKLTFAEVKNDPRCLKMYYLYYSCKPIIGLVKIGDEWYVGK